MEADPSFSGWGGQSALPPTAGGGKASIQRPMNFIALCLAKRRKNPHVRNTSLHTIKLYKFVHSTCYLKTSYTFEKNC